MAESLMERKTSERPQASHGTSKRSTRTEIRDINAIRNNITLSGKSSNTESEASKTYTPKDDDNNIYNADHLLTNQIVKDDIASNTLLGRIYCPFE